MGFERSGLFRLLVAILVIELACPPTLFSRHTAQAVERRYPTIPAVTGARPFAGAASERVRPALEQPLMATLGELPEVPFTMALTADDPSLDSDPFFLRSQSWGAAEVLPTETLSDQQTEGSRFAFRLEADGFTLQARDTAKAWRLRAPLHPIYASDDYLILAADGPELFEAKQPGESEPGEGLFLISTEEWLAGAGHGDRVPVYFLPLPGNGWWGRVEAMAFPEQALIAVAGVSGESLPLQEADIEKVVLGAKLNLALATGAALRAAALGKNRETVVGPLAKSTAGFGVLFTGLHPTDPALNLFDGASLGTGWLVPLEKLWAKVSMPVAHAEPDPSAIANEKMVKNLLRVATVTGLALAAAVVLKYTVFREHFKKKHEAEPPTGFWGGIGRHLKDIGDVFAHNLTLLSNVAKVWFGNSVEYLIDRHFPRLGAAKNTLLRKFLDKTVYFSRDTGSRLPVNVRTLMLGAGVLGMIDSGLVAVQLYFVVPWMAQAIAQAVPALEGRVNNAFDVGNPHTETYNRNEVVRNLAAYIAAGASTVSADLKSQLLTILGPEVDAELRKKGLDPSSPRVKPVRDRMLNELLAEVEKQVGLPGKEEFLYDATTLWAYAAQMLGYSTPDELKKALQETELQSFQGQQRPGLLAPAVSRALKEARARLKADPGDAALAAAVKALEELSRNLSFLSNFVKYPAKWLVMKLTGRGPPGVSDMVQTIRRTRQQLIALTYDGHLSEELKHLPGEWLKAFGEPGAQLAGHLFRRSFFGLLGGDPQLLTGPTNAQREATAALLPQFEAEALEVLKDRYPAEYRQLVDANAGDTAKALTGLRHAHRSEFRLVVDDKVHSRALADADAAIPYKPARKGWFTRLQERRARATADERFRQRYGRAFNPGGEAPTEVQAWTALYAEAMMNRVGLYPDYDAIAGLKKRVEDKAQEMTSAQTSDVKFRKFIEPMTALEKLELTASLYADNLIQAYRDIVPNLTDDEAQKQYFAKFNKSFNPMTATKEEKKEFSAMYRGVALSTAQPGRFQWLRQTRWVKSSRFITRMVRALESVFPVEAHRPGLLAALQRNIPGLYDTIIGNVRTYRNAVTGAIAIYWFNYFVWGVALPAPMWIWNLMWGFMVAAPAQWMTRFFRMQGLQTMGGAGTMALYAFFYSWVTFWGSFPTLIFAEDFNAVYKAIQQVVQSAGSQILEKPAELFEACSRILGKGGG